MVNGAYKRKTLADVLKAHSEHMCKKVENSELAVLVKFVDDKKKILLEVYSNGEYSRIYEGNDGKAGVCDVIDVTDGTSLIIVSF